VIPDLIEQYVDTGKARFVYREFPLTSIHPNAQKASEAAVCAGYQDAYWEMNERLFADQSEWKDLSDPTEQFKSYAQELGLDTDAFNECLDSGKAAQDVQDDAMAAQSFGVRATPTFFINDMPVEGGRSVEALGMLIDYAAAGGTTPQIVPMAEGDWRVRGDKQTAKAVTVAFVDYASPESAQHHRDVLPKLTEEYIDSGKMLYVMHPWAENMESPGAQAAKAAECAGKQGQYQEMNDQLFTNQEDWLNASDPQAEFIGYAETLGMDTDEFKDCLDSDWATLRVLEGNAVAAMYGVPGAPVFLFNNGDGREGSPTFEEFQTIIDSILNR